MKKRKLKKIAKFFAIVIVFLYLVSAIISGILMSCMTSLTYTDIGFGITLTEYIVDFESNMAEKIIMISPECKPLILPLYSNQTRRAN